MTKTILTIGAFWHCPTCGKRRQFEKIGGWWVCVGCRNYLKIHA